MRTRMQRTAAAAAIVAAGTAGCRPRGAPRQDSQVESSPEGRKVIGVADDYKADGNLDENKLAASMKLRRDEAWRIVARTLRSVPLAQGDRIGAPLEDVPRKLRLWQTWYQSDEMNLAFRELYKDLGAEGRKAKKALDDEAIDAKLTWLAQRDVAGWTEDRFEKWLGNVTTPEDVAGVPGTNGMAGRGMTFFSPSLVRHLYRNYDQILRCGPTLATVPAKKDPAVPITPCFRKEFPKDAVAVKSTWVDAKLGVPRFATDADALTATLQSGTWTPVEDPAASLAQPSPSAIHTMRARPIAAPVGKSFRLTGLHIVTKETTHWMWVTLWWSDKPGEDFGADRPPEIAALGPAWGSYKMCVTSSFDELDEKPWQWYEDTHPSLAAALKATAGGGTIRRSWCSNPYIERGHGNARTNCIGCHQHAGTSVTSDDVFKDEQRFPDAGRRQERDNFPADYLWAFDAGADMFEPAIVSETTRQDAKDGP